MASAIDNGEFRVYYQSKADREGKLVNISEALARWVSVEKFAPDQFFTAADWHELLLPLSWHIAESIARDLKKFPLQIVSINLSPVELCSDSHLKKLCCILNPDQVKFEVVESSLLTAEAIDNMNWLHEIGYRIGIDDYGRGYSNIVHLLDCPIDYLKVDGSIIERCTEPKYASLLKHISAYCHETLQILVTAEKVETREQFEILKTLGYDYFQGYYFARPLPPEEIFKGDKSE